MEPPKDGFDAFVKMIAGIALIFSCVYLFAQCAFEPIPNDAINLQYSTAHQHAMRIENQAIRGARP